MRRYIKILLVNTIIFLALGVVVFAGLEIYLRLTIPASSQESIFEYTLETKRYKVMKKNAKISAWGVELKTNNLGFRDDDREIPPKKENEYRVVVLGDSFTVSAGVQYDRIYTSLLEKKNTELFPDVKFINLAVGGYNIVQYQLVLEEVGLKLNPDMILVSVFPFNDFEMDTYEENFLTASGRHQPKSPPWYQNIYVYRAYLSRLEARLRMLTTQRQSAEEASPVSVHSGWEENISALEAISDLAEKNDLKMIVAMLPNTGPSERQTALFNRLKEYCALHHMQYIDLLKPLTAIHLKESELRLNLLDAHPNERYNALVSDFLYPRLLKIIAHHYDAQDTPEKQSASESGS